MITLSVTHDALLKSRNYLAIPCFHHIHRGAGREAQKFLVGCFQKNCFLSWWYLPVGLILLTLITYASLVNTGLDLPTSTLYAALCLVTRAKKCKY